MCDEECLALHSNDTYNSRLDKNSAKIGQFFIYKYNGASPNDMAVARLSSGDKENGFILLGKIDMVPVQYEYQYLYILQKPE